MIRSNFHTHTNYVDGRDTPEAMVQAALALGFAALGFSEHAYQVVPDFVPCCMTYAQVQPYYDEIRALQRRYADRIRLYCALEVDWLSPYYGKRWDYIIGSVHAVPKGHAVASVDDTAAVQRADIDRLFAGDPYAFAEAYYEEVARMALDFRPDVVGHFDLLTKFNEQDPLYDMENPRYRDAAISALDTVLDYTGAIIEINTGAMARGYRRAPYPAPFLLKRVYEKGGRVMLASDSHSAATLNYAFDQAAALAQSVGFREAMVFTDEGFMPVPLD